MTPVGDGVDGVDVGGNPAAVVVSSPAVELQRVRVEKRGVLSGDGDDLLELGIGQRWELAAGQRCDDLLGTFQLEHAPDRKF